MSVSGLGWTGVVSVPGRRSDISSPREWMDYATEGELVNLPLMSSTHHGLLLCLGKVQLTIKVPDLGSAGGLCCQSSCWGHREMCNP